MISVQIDNEQMQNSYNAKSPREIGIFWGGFLNDIRTKKSHQKRWSKCPETRTMRFRLILFHLVHVYESLPYPLFLDIFRKYGRFGHEIFPPKEDSCWITNCNSIYICLGLQVLFVSWLTTVSIPLLAKLVFYLNFSTNTLVFELYYVNKSLYRSALFEHIYMLSHLLLVLCGWLMSKQSGVEFEFMVRAHMYTRART